MPKPLTSFAEVMITTYYGKRTLRWIGDQLGCSAPAVLARAKQLGLWKPTSGRAGKPIAPTVVLPYANHSFIAPPTREQLMAGSANVRRVYKVEA